MTLVEGQQIRCPEALGKDHQRGVGKPDVVIGELLDDLPGPVYILRPELNEFVGLSGDLVEKRQLSLSSYQPPDQATEPPGDRSCRQGSFLAESLQQLINPLGGCGIDGAGGE